ncbi:MAG: hypothetical protein Q9227_004379 [Pyrenula ochraceoflavens]
MAPTEEDIAWFKSTFHPVPKPRLPDDCVEYSLYLFPTASRTWPESELRQRLQDVQRYATTLQKQYLKEYIWQRENFSLKLIDEDAFTLLQGRTEYGDSIEDEWVIVWLLRELTKEFDDLWVRVNDNDGEFLLIEAAETLPQWLEPEVADNRVWIHQSRLTILKPPHEKKAASSKSEKLSIWDAQQIILKEPKRLMKSTMVEEEAFHRLRNYPDQIAKSMHHAQIIIPRRIAYLLHQKPSYISPAVEAFYLRDPIALKPLSEKSASSLLFSPEDFVTTSVTIPRVAYAQLRSQDFPAPKVWKDHMPMRTNPEEFTRAETGMKLACGFEMLLQDTQNQDKTNVREMKMLLEDLDTGDDVLPTDAEISQGSQQQDSEEWLDVNFQEFEQDLAGKGKRNTTDSAGFGDKMAQENLQRLVSQFENFMNDDDSDSDDNWFPDEDSENTAEDNSYKDTSDGEDKDASFNEADLAKMMREMMGMPPDTDIDNSDVRGMVPGVVQELESEGEEENADDIQTLMSRMEAELNESGALDLDPTTKKIKATQQAVRKGKAKANSKAGEEGSKFHQDNQQVDFDLMKELLEKFKGQPAHSG